MARYIWCQPTYKGYNLIGASNLVRFAMRYAKECPRIDRAKRIGLCISGMTAGKCGSNPRALEVLRTSACHGSGCIVLLGTNDALQAGRNVTVREGFRDLRKNLKHISRILERRQYSVVFLTVPPIPGRCEALNVQIRRINKFMLGWKQSDKLRVLPLHEVLCLPNGTPDTSLFERYGEGKLLS